jgi:hypothetical protein
MSEGNGHPYSWAAIFNGYDAKAMASCPFPVIPQYLGRQALVGGAIAGARVTHVWTQDRAIARHVAAASLIPTVVDRYVDMIGAVDAVLLARDDAENHLEMSMPFLDAGLPIYIDKPVALSVPALDRLYEHERYRGQLFSCSALRFSGDLRLSASLRTGLGDIRHIQAIAPKSWSKYGVHVVEPVMNMLGLYEHDAQVSCSVMAEVHAVTVRWGALSAQFTCTGSLPADIRIRLFGTSSHAELVFTDTYSAFKSALQTFVDGIRTGREMIPRAQLYGIVSILERGMPHGN